MQDTTKQLEVHPAALVLPEMDADDFRALVEDVRRNGVLVAVELHDGKILDGRHRARAAAEVGVEFETVEVELGDLTPEEYVWALNGARRHLTPSQRAAVAAELLPGLEAAAKQRQGARTDLEHCGNVATKSPTERSRDKAAKMTGASPRAVQDAKKIKAESPETFEQIKQGKTTIAEAKRKTQAATKPKPAPKPKPQYGLSDRFLGVLESFVIAIEEVYQTFGGPKAFHKHPEFDPKMLQFVEQHMQSLCQLIEQYRSDSDGPTLDASQFDEDEQGYRLRELVRRAINQWPEDQQAIAAQWVAMVAQSEYGVRCDSAGPTPALADVYANRHSNDKIAKFLYRVLNMPQHFEVAIDNLDSTLRKEGASEAADALNVVRVAGVKFDRDLRRIFAMEDAQ